VKTSTKAKISGKFFMWEETYGTPLLAATAANINFTGEMVFGGETYCLLV